MDGVVDFNVHCVSEVAGVRVPLIKTFILEHICTEFMMQERFFIYNGICSIFHNDYRET